MVAVANENGLLHYELKVLVQQPIRAYQDLLNSIISQFLVDYCFQDAFSSDALEARHQQLGQS